MKGTICAIFVVAIILAGAGLSWRGTHLVKPIADARNTAANCVKLAFAEQDQCFKQVEKKINEATEVASPMSR